MSPPVRDRPRGREVSAWRPWLGAGYARLWSWGHGLATAWRRRQHRRQHRRQNGAVVPPIAPLVPDRGEGRPRPRLLVVSPYSLHPPIHGGAVRIGNLTRRLAADFDIFLLIFMGGTDDPEQAAALADACVSVFFIQQPDQPECDPWGLRPAALDVYTSTAAGERIQALVDAHRIDLVMLEYTELAAYVGPYPAVPVVLVEHDIGFRTQARQGALDFGRRFGQRYGQRFAGGFRGPGAARDLRRLRRAEVRACRAVARIHTMSDADARYLAPYIGPAAAARTRVIPNGVDTRVYHPGEQPSSGAEASPRDVLFVGSFPHLPNRDALAFFVAAVWPRIRQRHPDLRLVVAGARPTDDVLALDGHDGITVVGEVDHLAPLYRSHALLVVPLRAGSGTRLKIMEALASGLPVVSTTLGAEGIDLSKVGADGAETLVLADGAPAFATAVGDLIDDPARRDRIAVAGRALVQARYDWDAIARNLAADLASLLPASFATEAATGTTHQEARSAGAVSVVVLAGGDHDRLHEVLAAVLAQEVAQAFEVIVVSRVDVRLPADQRLRAVTSIVVPRALTDGQAFNRGCCQARGTLLALLTADAEPVGRRWLADLVAPFDAPAPPSVIQGGIEERYAAGGPAHHLATSAPERAWQARHGIHFSWTNAAIRREVWHAHPFGADPVVEPLRWQRRLTGAGHLLLPILDVRVEQLRPWLSTALATDGWRRGAALRRLGLGYSLPALVGDLAAPKSFDQGRRWLLSRPVQSRAERLLPWLRPLAVFLGRWLAP